MSIARVVGIGVRMAAAIMAGSGGVADAQAQDRGWRSFAPLITSNSEIAVAQLGNQL